MAFGGDDVLPDFSKLSIEKKSKNLVEIAKGRKGKNLAIPEELFNRLYVYQKEGVRWLFDLFERGKGGILGDDMGLGKTVQMIAFLSGMLECKFIHSVLIVAPMSVINVWCASFKDFSPRTNFATFHGEKRAREKALDRIQDRGGVLVTTYDLVGREEGRLGRDGYGDEYTWDYVVADEGHQLKNKSIKRSQGAHAIPTKYRVILTGTPLQNKLPELWALFDWTHFGQLLGTMRTFNSNYGNAIEDGRKKCASAQARRLGNEYGESLRKIIEPYLLRRTKEEVGLNNRPSSTTSQPRADSSASEASSSRAPSRQLMPSLPRKNDLVVWLTLSKEQEDIYRRFLTTPEVKMLLDPSVKTSPLTQLIVLKKLCDHPRLLSENACRTLGIVFDEYLGEHHAEQAQQNGAQSTRSLNDPNEQPVDDLAMCIAQSIKTSFLTTLLPQLVGEGHKVLVFSMSLRMLNLIAQVLKSRLNIRFLRLDGQVTKLEDRQRILDKYQTSERYPVLLLTTQVGGVGLTITAADRVIIVDPAWNPAVDSQAVDRVYRVGQKRNVVIYRLITAGTVEEKIYRRQVFKVSIFKQIAHSSKSSLASEDDPMRYFTQQDLKELFTLGDTKSSPTQQQLENMHAHQRNSDAELDEHVEYVTKLRGVVGISDHDLLFTKPDDPTEVENGEDEMRARQTVERAKALMEQESRQPQSGGSDGKSRRPANAQQFESQQPSQGGGLYPRGSGESKPPNSKLAYVPPITSFSQMELPTDVPLYLQKKGLIKPGQTVLTPPKLIGRGQKENSFTLHRSYSDAEINGADDDDVMIIDDDEVRPHSTAVDEDEASEGTEHTETTESDGEKSTSPDENRPTISQSGLQQISGSYATPRMNDTRPIAIDDGDESSTNAPHQEVINLDSDNDMHDDIEEFIPTRRQSSPPKAAQRSSIANSSNQDSFIARGPRKNRRKVISDDDDDDDDVAVSQEKSRQGNISQKSNSSNAVRPKNVIVINDDDDDDDDTGVNSANATSKSATSSAAKNHLPNLTASNNTGTPSFFAAPMTSSTPFTIGGSHLKPSDQRQRSFPSTISPFGPSKTNGLTGAFLRHDTGSSGVLRDSNSNSERNSRGSNKRNINDRSAETLAIDSMRQSKSKTTDVVGNSINLVNETNENDEEEGSSDNTAASSGTEATETGGDSTEEYDHEEAENEEEVDDEEEGEGEAESDDESEDSEDGDVEMSDATGDDSNYRTAVSESGNHESDATNSHISLPKVDVSFAY